jgi:hypothetical protein
MYGKIAFLTIACSGYTVGDITCPDFNNDPQGKPVCVQLQANDGISLGIVEVSGGISGGNGLGVVVGNTGCFAASSGGSMTFTVTSSGRTFTVSLELKKLTYSAKFKPKNPLVLEERGLMSA